MLQSIVGRGQLLAKNNMFPLLNRNEPHVEQKILSYLGPDDLTMVAFVCKNWYMKTRKMKRRGVLFRAVTTGCEHLVAYILNDKQIDVNERSRWYYAWIPEMAWTPLYPSPRQKQCSLTLNVFSSMV